jgi:hypothetical protein
LLCISEAIEETTQIQKSPKKLLKFLLLTHMFSAIFPGTRVGVKDVIRVRRSSLKTVMFVDAIGDFLGSRGHKVHQCQSFFAGNLAYFGPSHFAIAAHSTVAVRVRLTGGPKLFGPLNTRSGVRIAV